MNSKRSDSRTTELSVTLAISPQCQSTHGHSNTATRNGFMALQCLQCLQWLFIQRDHRSTRRWMKSTCKHRDPLCLGRFGELFFSVKQGKTWKQHPRCSRSLQRKKSETSDSSLQISLQRPPKSSPSDSVNSRNARWRERK